MAAKYDDRTARGWPLPRQGNRLYDDVERLREALTLIDQSITDVDTHESTISERQDFIETRMDVIVGQATEDTEILDARVDAEGVVHPNLGHNIRNAHVSLVRLVDDFRGLLRQFTALAEAKIQGELNSLEAHERRKKEIQLEALTRMLQDDGLQRQIDEASIAILQTTLNLYDNNNRRKADLEQEQIARANDVDYLQGQIITLSKLLKVLTEALSDTNETVGVESQARVDGDLGLARQANANAEAVMWTELNLLDANERLKAKLFSEEQARNASDKDLQIQVDEISNASLENSLTIAQEAERRRDLADEVQDNFEYLCDEDARLDAGIETEAAEREAEDETLKLAINSEKSARAEQISRLDEELNEETQARVDGDLGLARQANANAEAVMRTELNLLDADRRRKEDLAHEERERIEHDADLQRQINRTAESSLENALNLTQEAEQRRKSDERIDNLKDELDHQRETDEYHQTQIDDVVRATLENSVTFSEGMERRREALIQEAESRITGDKDLQIQVDEVSNASLENSLAIANETKQRRKFGDRIKTLENDSELSVERDTYHQTQLDFLVAAVLQGAANLHDEIERRRVAVDGEAKALAKHSRILQSEIDKTAMAILENFLAVQKSNEARRAEDSQERFTRFDEDGHIQDQVNALAETCMRIMMTNAETQEKINKIAKATESISGITGVASDTEVDEMLDEIYNS